MSDDLTEHEPRVTRRLGNGTVFEYVPGPNPYIWIGKKDGRFLDSIDVRELRRFLAEGASPAAVSQSHT